MAKYVDRPRSVVPFEKSAAHAYHSRKQLAPLFETYSLQAVTPVSGQWYFGAECAKCRRVSPLFKDASAGKLGNPYSGPGGFNAKCFHCKANLEVKSGQVIPALWN